MYLATLFVDSRINGGHGAKLLIKSSFMEIPIIGSVRSAEIRGKNTCIQSKLLTVACCWTQEKREIGV